MPAEKPIIDLLALALRYTEIGPVFQPKLLIWARKAQLKCRGSS